MDYFLTQLCVLGAVAFYTLLERKGLSYTQLRKGPNKVGFIGVPQPLADAVKLLAKELVMPYYANPGLFLLAPVISLTVALVGWMIFPVIRVRIISNLGLLFFLCVTSLNVYAVILAG